MLELTLIEALQELGWKIDAWAVFENHYHLVGDSPHSGLGLAQLTRRVHSRSALALNRIDASPGRQVWYRSFDTRLTFEKSYLGRLAYIHNNPVKHGLVKEAVEYPWCSAAWFRDGAPSAFYEAVMRFETDKVQVYDHF